MKNIIKLLLAISLCALLLIAVIPQSTLFAQGGVGAVDEEEAEEDCVGAECDAEIVQDDDECVDCGELDATPQDDECAGDDCGELEKEEKPKKDEPKKDEPKEKIPQVEIPSEEQQPKPSAPEPKLQIKPAVKPKVEVSLSPEEKIEQEVEEVKEQTVETAQQEAQQSIKENKTQTITKEITEFKQEIPPEIAPEIAPLINEIQQTLTTLPPPAEAAVTDSDNDTIADSADIDRFDPDNNNNGIIDGLEFAINPQAPTIIDTEDIQLQATVTAAVTKEVLTGVIPQEKAPIIIKEEIKKKRAEKRDELIEKVAEKKYRTKIKTKEEQVKVYLAIDPKLPEKKDADFTRVEEKIYRLDLKKALKKIATNLRNGDKLSSKGTTILAACPKCESGQELIIVAIDKKGRETKIGSGKFSDNHKAVIAIERPQLKSKEKYILQARLAARVTSYHGMLFASVLNEEGKPPESSEPVLVDIRDDEELDIPQPIVKSIEGIEVAGLRDVKISASADGKVRATGLVDASAMVVGNFSSAVFSSAILADVNSGTFEVVSPQKLEAGDHEVIIYATRPEEGSQSAPVRVRFSIIETAKAADGGALTQTPIIVVPTHGAAPSKFPWVLVLGGIGVIVVLISIGIIFKKRAAKT